MDRFLGISSAASQGLSDGSVYIRAASIGATNLAPSMTVKTDASGQLITSNLEISDVNNLQTTLASTITNPYNATLSTAGIKTNTISDVNGVSIISLSPSGYDMGNKRISNISGGASDGDVPTIGQVRSLTTPLGDDIVILKNKTRNILNTLTNYTEIGGDIKLVNNGFPLSIQIGDKINTSAAIVLQNSGPDDAHTILSDVAGFHLKDKRNRDFLLYQDLGSGSPDSFLQLGNHSDVSIGNIAGGSTVWFNNNRLVAVADAINGTDAVNLRQLENVGVKSAYLSSSSTPTQTSIFDSDIIVNNSSATSSVIALGSYKFISDTSGFHIVDAIGKDQFTYNGATLEIGANAGAVTLGGPSTLVLSASNKKIQEVASGASTSDAVNFGQLKPIIDKTVHILSNTTSTIFSSDVVPFSSNTKNLGADTQRFRDLYISRDVIKSSPISTNTYSKQWGPVAGATITENFSRLNVITAGGFKKYTSIQPLFSASSTTSIKFICNTIAVTNLYIGFSATITDGLGDFSGQQRSGTIYNNGVAVGGVTSFWGDGIETELLISNKQWTLKQGSTTIGSRNIIGVNPFYLCFIDNMSTSEVVDIKITSVVTNYEPEKTAAVFDGAIVASNMTGIVLKYSANDTNILANDYLLPGDNRAVSLVGRTSDVYHIAPYVGEISRVTYIKSLIGLSFIIIRIVSQQQGVAREYQVSIPNTSNGGVVSITPPIRVLDGEYVAVRSNKNPSGATTMGKTTVGIYIAPVGNSRPAPNEYSFTPVAALLNVSDGL